MKRTLNLGLIVLLCFVLVACGNNDNNDNENGNGYNINGEEEKSVTFGGNSEDVSITEGLTLDGIPKGIILNDVEVSVTGTIKNNGNEDLTSLAINFRVYSTNGDEAGALCFPFKIEFDENTVFQPGDTHEFTVVCHIYTADMTAGNARNATKFELRELNGNR